MNAVASEVTVYRCRGEETWWKLAHMQKTSRNAESADFSLGKTEKKLLCMICLKLGHPVYVRYCYGISSHSKIRGSLKMETTKSSETSS